MYEVVSSQVLGPERLTDWSISIYSGPITDPDLILIATDFGAVGDSLTDNSTAAQDALDFLEGRQGVIYFPDGTYLFNSPLMLSDSVVIRGKSSELTHFVFDLGGESIQLSWSLSACTTSSMVYEDTGESILFPMTLSLWMEKCVKILLLNQQPHPHLGILKNDLSLTSNNLIPDLPVILPNPVGVFSFSEVLLSRN